MVVGVWDSVVPRGRVSSQTSTTRSVPVLQVVRPIPLLPLCCLSIACPVPYVESFLSGFAIGVLKRDTDEALMNLRRDSFAPQGRYPLTRFDVERWSNYSKGTNQFGNCRASRHVCLETGRVHDDGIVFGLW